MIVLRAEWRQRFINLSGLRPMIGQFRQGLVIKRCAYCVVRNGVPVVFR